MKMLLFCKTLTKTDIEYRLHFPTHCLQILPFPRAQRHIQFLVKYRDNPPPSTFICIKRNGRYSKPTITRGWLEIVREKQLKVGDRLRFYIEAGDQPMIFRIEAERLGPMMLFGSRIGTYWQPII